MLAAPPILAAGPPPTDRYMPPSRGVVYDCRMAQPEYVICLECETPVYVFEWREGRVLEALCPVCGNDDPASFASEEDLEEMASGAEDEE